MPTSSSSTPASTDKREAYRQPPHHYHYALRGRPSSEFIVESPVTYTSEVSIFAPGSTTTTLIDDIKPRSAGEILKEDIVFCDPVAFRYLEDEECTNVVARNQNLEGYESYIVEQWTCSRSSASLVISTYTGDPTHKIVVNVLRIPKDETQWTQNLRGYFRAVRDYGARPKQTDLGVLYVINLSSFPSALTVVLVPDGDPPKHRHMFIVNEDLKRMGCSGRTALSLAPPTDATLTKYYQTYKVSTEIPYESSVIELVRLCQVALMAFGKMPDDPKFLDGLLCDVTEKSIRDWWSEFGTEDYDVEPNDGALGPMTVAGLLGMLLGARARLAATGAPVPKDAFDLGQLGKAIYHFQKMNRLPIVKGKGLLLTILTRETLTLLKRVTSKDGKGSTSSDIFAVPRAIRSTVVEMGARAVGSSTGQVDPTLVETVNIDRFIQHLSGESCKFLWHGKPRKTPSMPLPSGAPSRRNSTGASGGEEFHPSKTIPSKSSTQKSPPNTGESANSSAVYVPHQDSFGSVADSTVSTTTSVPKSSVFRQVTGRMKKAGADYVRSSRSQPVYTSRRSDSKDIYQNSTAPTSSTPLVITAPSSPKLPPQPQQVVYQHPSAAAKSAPMDTYGLSSAPEPLITAENPPKSESSSLSSELPQVNSLKLRRKSTPDEPAPRNDAFYPRRLSFSLAMDALSTSGWELPFSPPSPIFTRTSEQLAITSTWAQQQINWLSASTDILDHETEALERQFEEVEAGSKPVEEAKRRLLKEVDKTEAKVEECKYVRESTERNVKDLIHAVGGVERRVVELEEEWEEWEDARRGRKKSIGGWFW